MPDPILRIRLTEEPRDFRVISAGPGVPLIDRFSTADSLLRTWLGRFAAEPVFTGDHVAFFLRDDRGRQVSGINCEQVASSELKGRLRGEFESLKTRLRQAVPPSESARSLRQFVEQGLDNPPTGINFVALNCQFYKYVDHDGVQKLVWCPGFAPSAGKTCVRPTICREVTCRRLITGNLEPIEGLACPDCKKPFIEPAKPRRFGRALVALLLLLIAASGGGWWYVYGRPAGVLVGTVRATDGRPIAGAEVRVPDVEQTAVTDADGRFRVERIKRGANSVTVVADGYLTGETEAFLRPDAETAIDVTLTGAAQLPGRVAYKFNGKEIPIAGAEVTASALKAPLLTDDDGRFTFSGLPVNMSVNLTVVANGFRTAKSSAIAKVAGASETANPAIVLTGDKTVTGRVVYEADSNYPVPDADVSIIGIDGAKTRTDTRGQFVLSGAPPVEVQVQAVAAGMDAQRATAKAGGGPVPIKLKGNAVVVGEVVRHDDEPIPNIEVRSAEGPFVARTDDDGKFRIDGMPSGTVRLRAAMPGLVGMLSQSLVANQTTTARLVLSAGAILRGRVVARDQRPVPNAVVRVADTALEAKTDADGTYEIPAVPEAAGALSVSAADFVTAEVPLKLSLGEHRLDDVVLQSGVLVEGRVVSAVDGKPLAGAAISIVGTNGMKAAADDEGKFLLGPLPPGATRILVVAEQHSALELEHALTFGRFGVGDVKLQPATAVVGRVVRALDKKPIVGAEVEIAAKKVKVATNDQGEFRLDGIAYGTTILNITAAGYLPQTLTQDFQTPDALLDDTALVGDTAVEGFIYAAGDKASTIAGATIDIDMGDYKNSVGSGNNGRFVLGNIPAGVVKLTARAPGYKPETVTKTVHPGDAQIELSLVRLVTAKGVIVDASNANRAVPGASVTIIDVGGRHEAKGENNGGFQINDIAPGSVKVVVAAPGYLETVLDDVDPGKWIQATLPPLVRARGRVLRADGAAGGVGGARISVSVGDYVQHATSDARGEFTVTAPVGTVMVKAVAEGFLESEVALIFAGTNSLLEVRLSQASAIKGFVVDATTNLAVVGATVEAVVGEVRVSAVTGSQGLYAVENVPVGRATVTFSAPGYESLTVAVGPGEGQNLRAVLSPTLEAGMARVVLTWSDRPRDLDGYLIGADTQGNPFHVSFDQREAAGAKLDIDDKDGFGPETCTLRVDGGTYRFYVTHPENIKTADGSGLTRSNALVRIHIHGATESRLFQIPTNPRGPVWHVCDFTRDPAGQIIITPRNEFSNDLPTQ